MGMLWLESLALTVGLLTVVWCRSLVRRDASVIDPFWGMGFVAVAWYSAWRADSLPSSRTMLLCVLTTIWGLRLSLFLLIRNWGHAEDRRYRAMRDKHGPRFWWVSYLTVFLLQGVLLTIVATPLIANSSARSATPVGWLDAVGVAIWAVGVIFEAVGDWQMFRFQRDPNNTGRVMDRGLWRYTRHPNYFGDFCVWWGLFLIAAAGGAWWTVFAPLLMSVLLMKVSGVSLLEKTITSRRPEYVDYQRRTSAFFPWPPIASAP